jgi:DNA polymerase zeta
MSLPCSSNPTNGLPTKMGYVQCSSNESAPIGTTTSNSIDSATRAEHLAAVLNNEGKYPSNRTIGWEDGQSAHPLNRSHKLSSDPSSMVTPKSTSSVVPTAVHSSSSFPKSIAANPNAYIYVISPPSISELIGTLDEFTIPNKIYRDAYYSNEIDAPDNPREYAGLLYHLNGGDGLSTLDEWGGGQSYVGMSNANLRSKSKARAMTQCDHTPSGGWEYASCPPSHREVKKWLTSDASRRLLKKSEIPSQVGSFRNPTHVIL